MFNYLFPIFCFGLAISGVVYLGIIEAAKQAKSLSMLEQELKPRVTKPDRTSSRNDSSSRLTARKFND